MEDSGDLVSAVELPRGNVHHQIVGGVVVKRQAASVEAVEGDERGQREPLVAVDEGVITCQRVKQRGSLGIQRGIGVLAEGGGLRTCQSGFQQAVVAYRITRSECALGDVEQLRQRQEDHWPSRSRASAYRGSSLSRTRSRSSASSGTRPRARRSVNWSSS